MPKIELQPKDEEMLKKINKVAEGTNIVQRQLELTCGHWDFVVFGPSKSNMVIREGYAQHVRILDSSAYIISVAEHGNYTGRSYGNIMPVPIEELVADDIPDELKGLEVLNVDPLRPLSISFKKTFPLLKGEKLLQDNYADKNIAIIQTPDEKYWAISVLKYLNECDRFFPDFLNDAIRKGQLPINARFTNFSSLKNKGSHLH